MTAASGTPSRAYRFRDAIRANDLGDRDVALPTAEPAASFGWMVADEALAWAIMSDREELLPRPLLARLQLERLRETLARVLRDQSMSSRLGADGVAAGRDLRSLGDLQRLPLMSRADLGAHHPFRLLTTSRAAIALVDVSDGALGEQTVVQYTPGDLERQAKLIERWMSMAGVRAGMLILDGCFAGRFMGGPAFQQGAVRIGAGVIAAADDRATRQASLLRDLGAHVLVATPSRALAIAHALGDQGVARDDLRLELGLLGGEPLSDAMRAELEDTLGVTVVSVYCLPAHCGREAVAAECIEACDGLHVHEDHFLVEVIDPGDGRPSEPETDGELVVTTLNREALPLIRYRTGDIGHLVDEPCRCGRTTVRLRRPTRPLADISVANAC